MPGWPEEVPGVLVSLLLCAVCLASAMQTLQINRGAAAGYLLQAVVSAVEAASLLGRGPEPADVAPAPDVAWLSTVAGLPLLVFGFHWLHGDCATANTLLAGALLLTAGWGTFTEEGKAVAAHSVSAVAAATVLIVSVFTGNPWGVGAGLLVGLAGLLSGGPGPGPLPLAPGKRDALQCLMAAANFALQRALRKQQWELDQGCGELFAAASD